MQPQFAKLMGSVHGGWIMKLVDEAGALAAMRHAQTQVVTVAIDQMSFHSAIRIGDLVTLDAEVTFVGNTSIETRVHVVAEDPRSGDRTHANTAYLVYVALDTSGEPTRVPRLSTDTEAEQRRMARGEGRQADRLARMKADAEEVVPMTDRARTLTELLSAASARRFLEAPLTEDLGLAEGLQFPFLALVGQSEMKLALILSLINPNVDGVFANW